MKEAYFKSFTYSIDSSMNVGIFLQSVFFYVGNSLREINLIGANDHEKTQSIKALPDSKILGILLAGRKVAKRAVVPPF